MTTIGKSRSVLVLHPAVPANNLQELIALIKAKPGEFNFASSGVGTNTHLSGELFARYAKIIKGAGITHQP